MRKLFSLLLLVCLVLVSVTVLNAFGPLGADTASPTQDGTLPALAAIAGNGMMSTESYDDLEELSSRRYHSCNQ